MTWPPCWPSSTTSPVVVVCPQSAQGSGWSAWQDGLLTPLDDVLASLPIDCICIDLTGLSMGGRDTWQLAVEHPERFAATAPNCGRAPDMPDFSKTLSCTSGF